jgi:hypothetical protein
MTALADAGPRSVPADRRPTETSLDHHRVPRGRAGVDRARPDAPPSRSGAGAPEVGGRRLPGLSAHAGRCPCRRGACTEHPTPGHRASAPSPSGAAR